MNVGKVVTDKHDRIASVLYILPYLEAGGTEHHVLHLIRSFRNKARVALLSPPGPMLDEFLKTGAAHQPFPRLEHDFRTGIREFRRRLRALIQHVQPDVIHVHAAPELAVLVRTIERRIPTVLTLHGFAVANPEANYKLAGLLSRLGRVRRLIAVSEAEANMLRRGRIQQGRLHTVYNGIPDAKEAPIDWRAELNWPATVPVIGAVGRLERVKGFDLLLEAMARLKPAAHGDRLPNEAPVRNDDRALDTDGVVNGGPAPNDDLTRSDSDRLPRLVIVGDGSEREALERQTAALGLADRVHWAGFRTDAYRAPGGFDVAVLPSRQEALPLACLEAMAAGRPVVASDAGGLPEAVEHGRTGYVFPVGDVDGLTDALQQLLNVPAKARTMGVRARAKFLNEFHVDQMTANTWAVYEEAVGDSCRG